MHDEWALAESMAERLPTVLEQEWARWMIDGARLRMNDPDALRIFDGIPLPPIPLPITPRRGVSHCRVFL